MPLDVEIHSNYDIPAVAREWTQLEARTSPSFFLSWAWIGCWLETTGARPLLVRARAGSQIVALGFFGARKLRRHLISVRQLCLNETGHPEHDRLTIEHNGFLIANAAPNDVEAQIFRRLNDPSAAGVWDELVLNGVSADVAAAAEAASLTVEMDSVKSDYCIDLQKVRQSGSTWLAGISSNLRSQIRQSRAFAERIGPLGFTAARTVPEALEYFEELSSLHSTYWRSRGLPGAFSDDFSKSFHKTLIAAQVETGGVEILRLSAGERTLGYLYNFLCGQTVSNYQSGFCYLDDNRHRPGLLAHALAIERALSAGRQTYDLLAGDNPYKQRLGEPAGQLIWCRAQRRRPALKLERFARRVKHAVNRLTGSARK